MLKWLLLIIYSVNLFKKVINGSQTLRNKYKDIISNPAIFSIIVFNIFRRFLCQCRPVKVKQRWRGKRPVGADSSRLNTKDHRNAFFGVYVLTSSKIETICSVHLNAKRNFIAAIISNYISLVFGTHHVNSERKIIRFLSQHMDFIIKALWWQELHSIGTTLNDESSFLLNWDT